MYNNIINNLQSLANPEIAEHSQRFFKTGKGEYGEGDLFLGIRVPIIRQAVKRFKIVPLPTLKRLLKSEFHEIRLFALLSLVYQYEKTDQQEEIYKIYLSNTRYINNWDLVDTSTPNIVGSFLVNNDRKVLYNLAESDSLWERRISILATFKFIRNGQFKDTLLISEILLNDDEDLIHKAVGWMLREVGNRDQQTEEKFLIKHYNNMPRTMLRYAIEKFEEEKRQKYLKGKI
ncbi:DNA alkylation repair protein [bacterium]|nr:DNA alkylation repair protein [bacterium]